MTMISLLMVNLSMMFIFMKHPITMGMTLLLQTLMISLNMSVLIKNSWFSYIMFLIMIGGLLIIFIYMTSLISNKKFMFSLKFLTANVMLMMLLWFFTDKFLTINNYFMFNQIIEFNFNKYINSLTVFIMVLSIIYLLMTMIAVVKITQFKSGPLRQKF